MWAIEMEWINQTGKTQVLGLLGLIQPASLKSWVSKIVALDNNSLEPNISNVDRLIAWLVCNLATATHEIASTTAYIDLEDAFREHQDALRIPFVCAFNSDHSQMYLTKPIQVSDCRH